MTRLIAIIIAAVVLAGLDAAAQRRITPVTPADPTAKSAQAAKSPDAPGPDLTRMAHTHDENGNIVLVDTVTGMEYVDSTAFRRRGYVYPRLHAATVGLNAWDPIMRAIGQKFGIASVWAEVSFHNRFNPMAEIGLGTASSRPDDMNFTFKSPVAPFFKIGCNYNFLYNSNPDYQIYAGVRYGFSPFSWHLTDVVDNSSYWGESQPLDFPSQHTTAGFLELGLGIKVRIAGRWSLGWMGTYHTIVHESGSPHGKPMVIPGFGKRNQSVTASFSIMYTLPLNRPAAAVVDTSNND